MIVDQGCSVRMGTRGAEGVAPHFVICEFATCSLRRRRLSVLRSPKKLHYIIATLRQKERKSAIKIFEIYVIKINLYKLLKKRVVLLAILQELFKGVEKIHYSIEKIH